MVNTPAAIKNIFTAIHAKDSSAVLLGIDPNEAHLESGGYHVWRDYLKVHHPSDYSIQHANDRLGNGENASAIDIGFGGYGNYKIKLYSQRLYAAGVNRDPRMAGYREFYGCGQSSGDHDVIGWDFEAHARAYTSDYSHRGHFHLSVIREYSDNLALLAKVVDVLFAVPLEGTVPPPVHPATKSPHHGLAWPSANMSGLAHPFFSELAEHGVYHGWYVQAIQQQLAWGGYVPGIIDGNFGANTKAAVTRFQHAHMPGTKFFGQVWSDDFHTMMSM